MMSVLRKILVVLAVLLVIVVGGLCYVWWGVGIRDVWIGDTAAMFAGDVGKYVAAHGGNMPGNWKEFEDWCRQERGSRQWIAEEIQKRVELQKVPYEVVDGLPRYVRITDPQLKNMESFINRGIHGSRPAVDAKGDSSTVR
jgi:hypothetical protein